MKRRKYHSKPISICLTSELREKLRALPNFSSRLRRVIEEADEKGEFDDQK